MTIKYWADGQGLTVTGLGCLVALTFTWSVPGTTALRYFFMLAALLVFSVQAVPLMNWREYKTLLTQPLGWYGLLTAWLVLGIFLSDEPLWVVKEIKGQWLKSSLSLGLGLCVAYVALGERSWLTWNTVVSLIFAVLFSQVAGTLLDDANLWLLDGVSPYQSARLSGSKAGMSYVTNIYMAFLAAEILARAKGQARMLSALGWPALLGAVIIGLICTALLGARNGVIGILFLLVVCTGLYWLPLLRQRPIMVAMGVAFMVGAITVIGAVMIKMDARWQRFGATVPVALDIDGYRNWIDSDKYGMPELADGGLMDESAYLRIAWLRAGLREVAAHPLGVGYGRNAFGHAMVQRYGEGHGHSHSSVLDFLLGAGIPGLVLWFAFLGTVMAISWRAYRCGAGAPALALIFLCSGFLGRSFVDSNMRDHTMEMFMFLLGLLLLRVRVEPERERANES